MGCIDSALLPVPGFEGTDYVMLGGRLRWAGPVKVSHPRNLLNPFEPRQPSPMGQGAWRRAQAIALRLTCKSIKGLLLWQRGLPLLSPFQHAAARFDRIKSALRASDDADLLEACMQVVGLGPGLTPSGDDFLGGLFFALGCSPDWQANSRFERLRAALILRTTAMEPMLTNPISYALMLDLMHQSSYQPVHELLEALGRADEDAVLASCEAMMHIGSSSGYDILAGILTALTYDK